MPYITNERREIILEGSHKYLADNSGELNFQITDLIIDYVVAHGLKYQTLNDVIGALDGAKAEFQRRVVGPYEDKKIKQNGDVYPKELL